MFTSTPETRSFLPGERVPQTGVYQCKHSNRHSVSRELVFETGMKFPLCNTCFWSVRYLLVSDCTTDHMDPVKRKKNESSIRAMSA